MYKQFDVIVVGAGHAGIEACLAVGAFGWRGPLIQLWGSYCIVRTFYKWADNPDEAPVYCYSKRKNPSRIVENYSHADC